MADLDCVSMDGLWSTDGQVSACAGSGDYCYCTCVHESMVTFVVLTYAHSWDRVQSAKILTQEDLLPHELGIELSSRSSIATTVVEMMAASMSTPLVDRQIDKAA